MLHLKRGHNVVFGSELDIVRKLTISFLHKNYDIFTAYWLLLAKVTPRTSSYIDSCSGIYRPNFMIILGYCCSIGIYEDNSSFV